MRPLADEAARTRIREETAATLVVDAGAGSGKTTALVDRVLTLVLRDRVPLRAVVAVTFTEKAGAELRDRLRAELERRRRADAEARALVDEALDDLDGAAIGTLHSFAQRILTEHPVEAGLPPLVEVLDEVGSTVAFEERWSVVQAALLDDHAIAEPLLLGMAAGLQLKDCRSLTLALGRDWDRIEDEVLAGPAAGTPTVDVTALRDDVAAVVALADHCADPDDRLLAGVRHLAELGVLLGATDHPEAVLEVLRRFREVRNLRFGRAAGWAVPVAEVRARAVGVVAAAAGLVARVLDACVRAVTRWLAARVLEAAAERRREGRLEFHDLLVLSRDLLRRSPEARNALHARYRRLLLDEFQDTDPIQIELAVRIAAGADGGAADWHDVPVPPGRLFVVGDPKQSIYKFRRADIATYLDAAGNLGGRTSLTTNFRTVPAVLAWVNHVFAELIREVERSQPAYQPLGPYRLGTGRGDAITVLGAEAHDGRPTAADLRTREAADVAAVLARVLDERWEVYDERLAAWRPAGPSDIAVLVPARTSLPFLEDALDAAGIAYRAEASSLVYQAREVRDLMACTRAVADASDAMSLVTALRSPLFGCGDDDLWAWKQARGAFHLRARLDGPVGSGPVGTALAYLRRLHRDARWQSPSETLAAIVADRRMLETAAVGPRSEDAWRRLRFVVDQARAWSEASPGGLRAYLAWAAHQAQEGSRVAEPVLPETDTAAVRISTIHAAKGLEYPIVVLSGLTAQPRRASGVRLLWPPSGGYQVSLRKGVETADFDEAVPLDEQLGDHERRRLLYVGATRARDHLVVSLHRSAGSTAETAARLLAGAGGDTAAGAVGFVAPPAPAAPRPAPPRTVAPPPDREAWLAGVRQAREAGRRTSSVSASGLEGTEPEVVLAADPEPGLAKGARDLHLPPWTKGRYGSAVGRAVHGVLQQVDLAADSSAGSVPGLDEAVAAQCLAEGVVGHAELVASLASSALASDLVRSAAAREHWRETYVGTTRADGTVLEGYVDLVYRDDDGTLVVVDYKTDAVPAGGLAARVTYYTPQLRAYAECLTAASGSPVRTVLLFLHPEAPAVEAEVGGATRSGRAWP